PTKTAVASSSDDSFETITAQQSPELDANAVQKLRHVHVTQAQTGLVNAGMSHSHSVCTKEQLTLFCFLVRGRLSALKFEVSKHDPYSAGLAPSDYHLFGLFKDALRGCRFTTKQAEKEEVHASYSSIQKLVQQWTKCEDCMGVW
uniref:Uncharacterized protein n=1 Tax=Scleropages formosus TaxID=113540 RepID=A0A8C9R174_SCLFO